MKILPYSKTMPRNLIVGFALSTFAIVSSAWGQAESRAAQIAAQREKKAADLRPEEVSKTERVLIAVRERRIVERISGGIGGVRLKLGGLATGSGFGLGPEYFRPDLLDGQLNFRAVAQASFRGYQKYEMELSAPKLLDGRMFIGGLAGHTDYPSLQYYGPGPDSSKNARSNFRREETTFDFIGGISPVRHLKIGFDGGYLMVNTGPGTDNRFASIEQSFTESTTPGLTRQSNFLRGGGFVQWDYRDNPGGPRKGGNYLARYLYFSDRTFGEFSFAQLDVDLQQYFPFFNDRRVIVLRGHTTLTDARSGQRVPFYLQPVLGGSESLRGFRPFRFYDDNLMQYTAEYRWESFSGLDMALFADAGKVFRDHSQWNFKDLEASWGFGFRFNVRNNVFLRVDIGFSHEGYQIWFKFNNVF